MMGCMLLGSCSDQLWSRSYQGACFQEEGGGCSKLIAMDVSGLLWPAEVGCSIVSMQKVFMPCTGMHWHKLVFVGMKVGLKEGHVLHIQFVKE